MKILIADDSMTMRGIVRNCLQQIGLEDIVEAENGAEALSAVRDQGDVSLVLCDWHMPVMDGLEFVKRMQAQPQTRAVPIIMVTSEREKANVIRALQAGASDYVVKPFTPAALSAKIDALVARAREQELARRGSFLVGRIEDTAVSDVVQLLARTHKSGALELDGPAGRFRLFVDGGRLVAAEGPAGDGEEAFFQAFVLRSGTFNFRADDRPAASNITRSTDALLLEAARRGQD